jgi:hypothetical protein
MWKTVFDALLLELLQKSRNWQKKTFPTKQGLSGEFSTLYIAALS